MELSQYGITTYKSSAEKLVMKQLLDTYKKNPIPELEILDNLGLYITSKNLARIISMNFLYQQIVDVQGVVIEFGVRWGQNLALFAALRGLYEPFNRHRKIIGFDTFKGFPSVAEKDGDSPLIRVGSNSVTKNYVDYLKKVMELQEKTNPISHIKKHELVVGDAVVEIEKYLEKYPETIVALAYFDFDIYEPTMKCLQAIKPRLVKGSVLGFDELNDHDSPGETIALKEVFGMENIRLKRVRIASRISYFVVE